MPNCSYAKKKKRSSSSLRIVESNKLIIKPYGQRIISITLIPWLLMLMISCHSVSLPVAMQAKLNIHKTLRGYPGHHLNVLRTFNYRYTNADLKISVRNKTLNISDSLSLEFSSYLPVNFVNFLISRLIFNIFYCFRMFVSKLFSYLMCTYFKK